jgi:hypothetical protein
MVKCLSLCFYCNKQNPIFRHHQSNKLDKAADLILVLGQIICTYVDRKTKDSESNKQNA